MNTGPGYVTITCEVNGVWIHCNVVLAERVHYGVCQVVLDIFCQGHFLQAVGNITRVDASLPATQLE